MAGSQTYLDLETMGIELLVEVNEAKEMSEGREHALADVVSAR